MDAVTRFSLDRSRLTALAMVGLILFGSILYSSFPKREDPEVSIRQSVVTTLYTGMTPERMEMLIADPVERKIREIPEVKEIETRIKTGRTTIDVTLEDSLTEMDTVWQELRDKMEEVARDLPEGTKGPFVNTNFGDVSIASIALTAEGFSMREMELNAQELQRRLYTVPGIAKVDLFGVQDERVWLELDAERLASVGVQIEQLISDLQSQNIILPAGTLNAGGSSMLLEASGDFSSVRDIENMITRVSGLDDYVRLGDLLTVRRGVVSPKEEPVFFNNRPAVVVSVQMKSGENIEAVGEGIKGAVLAFEQTLPIGYELNFPTFQPEKVSVAVNDAVSNVLQTFFVVLLVIMLFLGVRSGLIIASIVPFAVLFALIGMSIVEISLEQVSIAAIIISLGLLVDNGVVIVEDILKRLKSGLAPREAALQAGGQFAVPLLISSLTTIFAFMPFFLLEGNEGEYAFSLGAVVAMTLIGSWVSALYFLPYISTHFLSVPATNATGNHDKIDGSNDRFTLAYQGLLHKLLKVTPLTILFCYIAVALSVLMLSLVPKQMFPLSDRDQVLLYQEMPSGTDISKTEETAHRVSDWLMNQEENSDIRDHVTYVGSGGPRFYLTLSPAEAAPESAFFLVNLRDYESAVEFEQRARRYVVEQFPEARFKVKRLSMGASESGIVEVKISGPELDVLMSAARTVETLFRGVPGVSENQNDWGDKSLKVLIAINQDKARRTGITSEGMAQILAAYFDGYEVSQFREDDQSLPIVLRATEQGRDSADDLLNIIVGGGTDAVALEQIAVLQPTLEYSQIRRSDQVRTITVAAKSEAHTANELIAEVQEKIEALALGDGYKIEFDGETKNSAETNASLAAGFPVALLLMLVAIVFQFNSFRKTLIVFMSIPLIIIGVPVGLILFGQPMSFFGTLGIISLAGIIINNAIVLIDQIDIERQTLSLDEAIVKASSMRLRPILLTSATTVIGLVPLYLFGGSLWTPMAIVMMSGLAVASILTLGFVPSAYKLCFKGEG